jgi:hypothetical protein
MLPVFLLRLHIYNSQIGGTTDPIQRNSTWKQTIQESHKSETRINWLQEVGVLLRSKKVVLLSQSLGGLTESILGFKSSRMTSLNIFKGFTFPCIALKVKVVCLSTCRPGWTLAPAHVLIFKKTCRLLDASI